MWISKVTTFDVGVSLIFEVIDIQGHVLQYPSFFNTRESETFNIEVRTSIS